MLLIPGECAHWQQMQNSAARQVFDDPLLLVTPPGAAGVTDQQVSSWPFLEGRSSWCNFYTFSWERV